MKSTALRLRVMSSTARATPGRPPSPVPRGSGPIARSYLRQVLTPKGTLVLAGGEGGGRWLGMGRVMRAKAISPFVAQKMANFLARPKAEDLLVLKDLIEAGKVTPVIGAKYPLSDVPDAIRDLGTGHGRGKVVITI